MKNQKRVLPIFSIKRSSAKCNMKLTSEELIKFLSYFNRQPQISTFYKKVKKKYIFQALNY